MSHKFETLLFVLLFGYCLTEEKSSTEVDCICRLRLNTGKMLEKLKLSDITVSDKCDRNDFDTCAKACTQKTSSDTNGFDLDKPKASGDQQNLSLGQLYCDKVGADVSAAQILMTVTLECEFEKEITQERNGTVVSIGSSISQSSITRFIESGFKEKLNCVDSKYTNITTV